VALFLGQSASGRQEHETGNWRGPDERVSRHVPGRGRLRRTPRSRATAAWPWACPARSPESRWRYGSISLADALAPAIELAAQGITVGAGLAESLAATSERLQKWPSSRKICYKAGGAPHRPSEILVRRDLAASLSRSPSRGWRRSPAGRPARGARRPLANQTAPEIADPREGRRVSQFVKAGQARRDG
jgi:hypothetical protein